MTKARFTGLVDFIRTYNISVVIGLGFLLLIGAVMWTSFPAPYNPRYLLNRILKDPTFECADGVYSFAATTQGACSGHGGIKRRISKN